MTNELETAVAASLGGFRRRAPRGHAEPIGGSCANCATPLQGPWRHECGQSAEDFHRSIIRLAGEVVEGLLHMDGRLWRTLPDLMLRPARLTRAYLEGHRAPQIPPLRLFLVVLLGIFLVGGLTAGGKVVRLAAISAPGHGSATGGGGKADGGGGINIRTLDQMTPAERHELTRSLGVVNIGVGPDRPGAAGSGWLEARLTRALAEPERFSLVMEQWAERFAFLMLPVAALLMSLLFVFQRRFYLFDHTIFALHSLSAMGLVIVSVMVLGKLAGPVAAVLFLPAPVHLFAHMRGVYRCGVAGTLIRMALLFMGSAVAAVLLMLGLVAVGLNGMGG